MTSMTYDPRLFRPVPEKRQSGDYANRRTETKKAIDKLLVALPQLTNHDLAALFGLDYEKARRYAKGEQSPNNREDFYGLMARLEHFTTHPDEAVAYLDKINNPPVKAEKLTDNAALIAVPPDPFDGSLIAIVGALLLLVTVIGGYLGA